MIYYLANAAHLYPITTSFDHFGRPLADFVTPLAYEEVFERVAAPEWWETLLENWWPYPLEASVTAATLPKGTYLFTDQERLSPADATRAAVIWNSIAALGRGDRLLNHPTRAMTRYELLRSLYESGINHHNVYRLTEARWPERYPVILRSEGDHHGPRFELLGSREEVEAAIAMLDEHGKSREGVILVEFCNYANSSGVYRKYGAYRIGDRIIPKNVGDASSWYVKVYDLDGENPVNDEWVYVRENPHQDRLMEIFRRTRIDYGRVDYALVDGEVQVFEINTNPVLVGGSTRNAAPARLPLVEYVQAQVNEAYRALDIE